MQGRYEVQNKEKYVGSKVPYFRSSWELTFCRFCDTTESITQWASEPIKIPYKHPFTGKGTVYVPDFLVQYTDKNGQRRTELIEIKPTSQTTMESAGKSQGNRNAVEINTAKWAAAANWAKHHGVVFRIVTEDDIFAGTSRKGKKRK